MIRDSWIISLLLSEFISLVLIFSAAILAIRIARKWNISSSAKEQLVLERKSYLVSTIMMYVFSFEMVSMWLFVIIVNDHLPPIIKGAMCGTGSLNANQFGWIVLDLKSAEFVFLALWLILHHLDRKIPEYPLTREKNIFLLLLAPLVCIAFTIEALYFSTINPNIITTCCSITFDTTAAGSSSVGIFSAIPEGIIVRMFYGLSVAALMTDGLVLYSKRWMRTTGYVLAPITGVAHFIIVFLAIVHHYAKYIYGMPNHHCPFDMLWKEYYFVGYLIYALLFLSVISSLSICVTGLARRKQVIRFEATSLSRKAAIWNAGSTVALFVLLVCVEWIWNAAALQIQ
ncbi:MAG TPA: hypothetical protein VMW43_02350 [Bacteroidota bacterium]|nr:hypothetical protein [Bacteroidota bacterium]